LKSCATCSWWRSTGTSARLGCGTCLATPASLGLCFEDFNRLHDLRDLRSGASLRELEFGDAVWSKSVFESLEPLDALSSLRSLNFNAKRIDDSRIEPLAHLTRLEALRFPPRQFTTRQVAWLRAKLPTALESASLAPVALLGQPLELDGKPGMCCWSASASRS
jgi:hypothetical protein